MYSKKTRIISVLCIILTLMSFIAGILPQGSNTVYADSNDNRALDLAIAEGKTRADISKIATEQNGGNIDVNSMRTIALYLSNFYQPFVTSLTDGSDIGVSNKTADDKEAEKQNEQTGQFSTDAINALVKYCGVDEDVARILVKATLKQSLDTCHSVYVNKSYVETLFNVGGETRALSIKGRKDTKYVGGFRGFSRTLYRYKDAWSADGKGNYNFYTNYDTSLIWRLVDTRDGTKDGTAVDMAKAKGATAKRTTVADYINKLYEDGGSVTVDGTQYVQLTYFLYLTIIQYAQNKAAPANVDDKESKAVVGFYWYDKETNTMVKCFDSAGTCTQAFLLATNELDAKYGVSTSLSSLDMDSFSAIYDTDDSSKGLDDTSVEMLRKALIFFNPIYVNWVGDLVINDGTNTFVMVPGCLNPYSLTTISDKKTDYLNGVSVKALTYKSNGLLESAKDKEVYGLKADTVSSNTVSQANSKTPYAQALCTALINSVISMPTSVGESEKDKTYAYGNAFIQFFFSRRQNNDWNCSKDNEKYEKYAKVVLYDYDTGTMWQPLNLVNGTGDMGAPFKINPSSEKGTEDYTAWKALKTAYANANVAKFTHTVPEDDNKTHTFFAFYTPAGLKNYMKEANLKTKDEGTDVNSNSWKTYKNHYDKYIKFFENPWSPDEGPVYSSNTKCDDNDKNDGYWMLCQAAYDLFNIIKTCSVQKTQDIAYNEMTFTGADGRYDIATKTAMPTTSKEHFFTLKALGIDSGSDTDAKKHITNGNKSLFTFNRYVLTYGDTETKNKKNTNLDDELLSQRAQPLYDIMSVYGLNHNTSNWAANYVTFPSLIWSVFACADEPVDDDDTMEYNDAIKQWAARIVAGWRALDNSTTYKDSYAFIRFSGTKTNAAENMTGYKVHDQVVYFPDYSVDISDVTTAVQTANIFDTDDNIKASSVGDMSPYTSVANGYGQTLKLSDTEKELYKNIFMTYAFAEFNYEDAQEEFDEIRHVVDLRCNWDAFPSGSGTIDFTYIEDTTGKEIESFVYYLLHPTKGIAYVATWFKNKMAGILLYLHESIVGSSESNYTTGMTKFLGTASYTTMPRLTDIKLLNNVLSVYNNILIYIVMLMALILLCFIIVGEISVQRAIVGLVCFAFLAVLPPHLLNSSANVSNIVSDKIFSTKFEYWSISQMETYMDVINTSESEDVLTDNSLELATQVSLASAATSVGGQSNTGYSGTMVKWMSPKKYASSLVSQALQQTAASKSTASYLVNMTQHAANTSGNGQEFVHNADNALYLYRDYVDIYRYGSNTYNIDTYCSSIISQTVNDLLKEYLQNNSTQNDKEHGVYNAWNARPDNGDFDNYNIPMSKLRNVTYRSGIAVSDIISSNYDFGIDNTGGSSKIYSFKDAATEGINREDDHFKTTVSGQKSTFAMLHGFLYNTFGDSLNTDHGVNYFSYKNTRASTLLLTYSATIAQTEHALETLEEDLQKGKINITYNDFIKNRKYVYGIPHNSYDIDITTFNNMDDKAASDSDGMVYNYKQLSDLYYDLYSESPYFYFNYNIRDQLVNTADVGYQFSKADRTSSKNNLTGMLLVNNQDYFFNNSVGAGDGAGELRDFMNFHDFFYYIMPAFQPGLDLLETWDANFGYNLYDDCSFKLENDGTLKYSDKKIEAPQPDGKIDDTNSLSALISEEEWNNLSKNEQYELWHDYNVNIINLSYCSWLDTMEDCDYAKPETINVMGKKFRVDNPLDPTSYYKIATYDSTTDGVKYAAGDIISGRYMVFSRSEMKYYGLTESDLTKVERKIIKVQDEVYKQALNLMNYKAVSDENLIHAFAMLETFIFNQEFSQQNLATGGGYIMYPQGYELKAFTYDAYLRLVLAESSENIDIEDEGTTDNDSGNQEVTSIYKRIMDNTSIFFGVLLIFNDLLAVYAIPALKILILIVLFFLSIFMLISSVLKLDFNIFNNFVKNLVTPLLVFTFTCIGLSFLTSLFMSNGADYITQSKTTMSLGDPTMTIIIMIVMNCLYVYINAKLLVKCFRAMADYMKAVGFAAIGAMTGAFRTIGNSVLNGTRGLSRETKKLRKSMSGGGHGYGGDYSGDGGAKSRGSLNGAKALAGGALAGAATSAALAAKRDHEKEDADKTNYYNGLSGADLEQGAKDARQDSENYKNQADALLKANRKKYRSEIRSERSETAFKNAAEAREVMNDSDVSGFAKMKAFGSFAKNSVKGSVNGRISNVEGRFENLGAVKKFDEFRYGSNEFRGVNSGTVRQIKSLRKSSAKMSNISDSLAVQNNSYQKRQNVVAEQAQRKADKEVRRQAYLQGRAFAGGVKVAVQKSSKANESKSRVQSGGKLTKADFKVYK